MAKSMTAGKDHRGSKEEADEEDFGELIKYTGAGFAGGVLIGALLDYLCFHRSAIGHWLVRTVAGEGESGFEGVYALRQKISGSAGSMTEAYGWGKSVFMNHL